MIIFMAVAACPAYGADTSVRGVVTFRGTGEAGVYVEVFDRSPDASARSLASVNTGSAGRFTLLLPEGDYYLTAKKRPGGLSSAGMLFGTTGGDPVKVRGTTADIPPIVLIDSGGSGGSFKDGVRVSGRLTYLGRPRSGAFVYAYLGNLRRGPGYLNRVRSGEDGVFHLNLPPGVYSITVRSADGSEGLGSVEESDLVGEVHGGPVRVEGEGIDVGDVELRRVDREEWLQRRWAAGGTGLTISGRIVNEEGYPAAGAYAFVYGDHRMVGKPLAISAPTDEDGAYSVTVPEPGTYYLGARTRFGGPLEPGELTGAYDVDGTRPVELTERGHLSGLEIVVREVW